MPKTGVVPVCRCDQCGRERPVGLVTFKSNVSLLFTRRERQFPGRLCLACMTGKFFEFELTTAVGTWWGLIGCILGPWFLLHNLLEYGSGSFEVAKGARETRAVSPPPHRAAVGIPQGALEMADALVRLFRSGAAFELVDHEGARWVNELLRDAADPVAPAELMADASAVRRYVGAADGTALTRTQVRMFTARFETYLMENTAPNAEMARVFSKLRSWFVTVYANLEKTKAPISDDIRDWYVRIVTVDRDAPVLVPHRARHSGAA